MQRVDTAKLDALLTPPAPPAPEVVPPGGEALADEIGIEVTIPFE